MVHHLYLKNTYLHYQIHFLLDVLLVGPLVKGLSFCFLKDYHKRWQKSAVISGGMVLAMVSLMSVYGLLFNRVPLSMESYLGELGEQIL